MDMEEYFYQQQQTIKDIIKKIENIGVSDYHPSILKTKEKTLKSLKELYDQFEF